MEGSDPGAYQPGGDEEIVVFGAGWRARRPWLGRLLLAGLVIAALVFVVDHPSEHRAKHIATTLPTVSVTRLDHRILGISADWELFGLSTDSLVSIQFARGQITRTVLSPALRDAPVSLVVGPHQVVVTPLFGVQGYLVPTGQAGRSLSSSLARGGLLLPGPAPAEEWYIGDGQQITHSSGRQYSTTPTGPRPAGVLLMAVGPTNWLGLTCQQGHCRNVVVNATTGARRTLPGAALNVVTWPTEPGVVSPDGSLAAVIVTSGVQRSALDLVNLSTGRTTTMPVSVSISSDSHALAWSPDSRWLFALAASGHLVAVRAGDGSVHTLGVRLPALRQIAMRGGGQ